MRIGILQTGAVLEDIQPRFGDYPAMFVDLLSGDAHRRPSFSTYRVREGELPEPAACDAYVITGSRHSVYEDHPWIVELAEFVGNTMAGGQKIVGICFGHQLIAHYFGGRTEPASVGWGVGVHGVEIVSRERWMDPHQGSVSMLSSHKDQVVALPRGARRVASSAFCPNAAFAIGDVVMTWQGHPEFEKDYAETLMRRREALLGPETLAAGLASLDNEIDRALLARWILNFIYD
jgi:GMP synthase-like glutamine amidotransferase